MNDRTLFEGTKGQVQGRTVYKELATGYFLCVDNFHYGSAAHLELFDAQGRHLGEVAIIDGRLDTTKRDPTKRISVR